MLKKLPIDIVKKQIAQQTREDVGNIYIEQNSVNFKKQDDDKEKITVPVSWDKSYYYADRNNNIFAVNPSEFNHRDNIKYSTINTSDGDFIDTTSDINQNTRYTAVFNSGKNHRIRFRLITVNSGARIYVNNEQYVSAPFKKYNVIDVNIPAGKSTILTIYISSVDSGSKINIEGQIGKQIISASKIERCLYSGSLNWDASSPIDSYIVKEGNNIFPEVSLKCFVDKGEDYGNIGGISLFRIGFVEIGVITNTNTADRYVILGDGFQDNIGKYLRVGINIYTVIKAGWSGDEFRVYLSEDISGIADPVAAYSSIIHKVRDVSTSDELQPELSDGRLYYVIKDRDVENGKKYYYMLGIFDNSQNHVLGDLTDTYQEIIAGDNGSPGLAVIDNVKRSAQYHATIEINEPIDHDVDSFTAWYELPDSPNVNPAAKWQTVTVIDAQTFTVNNNTLYKKGAVLLFRDSGGSNYYTSVITEVVGSEITIKSAPSFGLSGSSVSLLGGNIVYKSEDVLASDQKISLEVWGLEENYNYYFYVSIKDIIGNVNYENMNRSQALNMGPPAYPTLSNSTNIISSPNDINGGDEILVGTVQIGAAS